VTANIPFHEAGLLKLNCDKALTLLKWQATLDYQDTIKFTSEWYYDYYKNNGNMMAKTINQIVRYEEIAKTKLLKWTA
jgi:CDP-glucose 4,6-dehydratase